MTAASNANTSGLIAEIDAEMKGRQRGYADVRGELLFRCRDALVTAASAQTGIADSEKKAELYDHMKLVAEANGFKSLTETIARATAAEARAERLTKALEDCRLMSRQAEVQVIARADTPQ